MLFLYHESVERIVLIDPNPLALSQAAENLIFNDLSYKATFVSAFASRKDDEEIDFYTVDAGAAGSRYESFAKTASKANSFNKVRTLTLDSIAERTKLQPDLIKIDVEGAESEVLEGCTRVAQNGAAFFVEMQFLE